MKLNKELNKLAPTRDAYGEELREMGSKYKDLVDSLYQSRQQTIPVKVNPKK